MEITKVSASMELGLQDNREMWYDTVAYVPYSILLMLLIYHIYCI